ncbi:MAG: hypothetical protein ABIN20_02615 [candidate division WOR-3 bacterium]
MKKTIVLIILFTLFKAFSPSFAKEVTFTQEDRDRLIKLEVKVEEGFKMINQRIEDINKRIDDTKASLQKQIDDLKSFMLWGFGILFGGMGILIGFVIWDRRTALAPAIRKNKELEEREERLERALKELAKKDPKVEEALKNAGLL